MKTFEQQVGMTLTRETSYRNHDFLYYWQRHNNNQCRKSDKHLWSI